MLWVIIWGISHQIRLALICELSESQDDGVGLQSSTQGNGLPYSYRFRKLQLAIYEASLH